MKPGTLDCKGDVATAFDITAVLHQPCCGPQSSGSMRTYTQVLFLVMKIDFCGPYSSLILCLAFVKILPFMKFIDFDPTYKSM